MTWSAETPYDDLPGLPPPIVVETTAVLKATIAARAALAALDQAATRLPNPWVLLNATSLLEAQASSEIENIVTTVDALFRYADAMDDADQATKEALRYRQALLAGVDAVRSRPLTFGVAERVCSQILERDMGVRRLPGTRIVNPATGTIIYAPPEGEEVIRTLLGDWERFVHAADGLDPLVRMAVAHYQFEAIHPFHDGNGRTGRIMNILMLIEAGLLSTPVLYLSRTIISSKSEYYRRLREVTSDGAWEPWVLYLLEAVRATSEQTLVAIDRIGAVREQVHDAARTTGGGRNADLLTLLFEQPYCRISGVVTRCGVSRPTATNWLNQLVEVGILRTHKAGRDRLYVNQRFLDVLARDEAPVRHVSAHADPTLF